jgi:integrating conjugative element protein (TIGR03752 family)
MGGAPSTALTRIVVPMGYAQPTGDQGGPLVRKSLAPVRTDAPSIGQAPFQLPGSQSGLLTAGQDGTFSPGAAGASLGKPDQLEPWYTIPENATLGRATAMTTIVGRVPVDGRVTDPMQFKLIVGRDNLAANGQRVPSEITGAIVSGLAVGDMGLSCVEGLIQSITFIFQDGTIRTISQRSNGSTPGLSSSGGGGNGQGSGVGGQSLAATSKLGWLSDGYGNPCIPGKFVTNAPRYLADVMGAKALSVAGAAIAAAETTTSSSTSANGSSESSTVTGNKGRYVMGKMASAGSEEVVNWLMRRLNNSFDAVVVPAGTTVAVHVDRELAIDRDPDGRRLDNSRSQAQLTQQRGTRHGAD